MFGYQTWDITMNIANSSLPWLPELSLVVNNLMDTRGVSYVTAESTATDYIYITPRSVTLRLEGRF